MEEYFISALPIPDIKFTDADSIQRRLYKERNGAKTGMADKKIAKRRRRNKLAKKARRRK